MKCKKCGSKNPKTARFCRGCGVELAIAKKEKPRKKHSLKSFFSLLIAGAFLFLIASIMLCSAIGFCATLYIDNTKYTDFELNNVKKIVTEYEYFDDDICNCVTYFYGKKDICLAKIAWANKDRRYFSKLYIYDEYENCIVCLNIDNDNILFTNTKYEYDDQNITVSKDFCNNRPGNYSYSKSIYDKNGNIKRTRSWYSDEVLPEYTFYINKYDDDELISVITKDTLGKTLATKEYDYHHGNLTYEKEYFYNMDRTCELFYEYDEHDNLIEKEEWVTTQKDEHIRYYTYDYDYDGLLRTENECNEDGDFLCCHEYTYNAQGDLTEIFYCTDEEYSIEKYYEIEYVNDDVEISLEEADKELSEDESFWWIQEPTSYYANVDLD